MNRSDLKNLYSMHEYIKELSEKYEERFNFVTKITSQTNGMPKAHNKPNYIVEEFLDTTNDLMKLMKEEAEKENQILKQINQLEDYDYRTILVKRYICKKAFEEIATDMNYSYSIVTHQHGEALIEFDKLDKVSKKKQDLAK